MELFGKLMFVGKLPCWTWKYPSEKEKHQPKPTIFGFHLFVFRGCTLFFCLKPLKKGCDSVCVCRWICCWCFFLAMKGCEWLENLVAFLSYMAFLFQPWNVQSPNFQGKICVGTMLKCWNMWIFMFCSHQKTMQQSKKRWSFWSYKKKALFFKDLTKTMVFTPEVSNH